MSWTLAAILSHLSWPPVPIRYTRRQAEVRMLIPPATWLTLAIVGSVCISNFLGWKKS
ncbi:hypothetical protein T440DRAFT_472122 [Plenodomus tracheiphilus IPT5]|uniref:Uncharacterized protein n=1 Tax=Plenodomus tracheiphilus IPT5 TaxID=1408161 RepID=A0A6A7ASA5_9PLEO|nr:hypothetical protein T440DRAFT_472122 [Plenodomus tracheiphilus IPT5]